MKTSKRILSVTIKRMVDDSPDTSWLGEYSNQDKSEFSIDRAHAEDCATVQPINESAQQTLRNARAHIVDLQRLETDTQDNPSDEWENLEEAYNLLDELADGEPECDCGGHGDMERNQYRYFNPGSVESFKADATWIPADVQDKETYWREAMRNNARQDYERMESLNRGNWCFIGIRADATIAVRESINSSVDFQTAQTITSGGLYGIESDSDAPYLASVEADELSDLKTQLLALGFSKRAIAAAFKTVERKES